MQQLQCENSKTLLCAGWSCTERRKYKSGSDTRSESWEQRVSDMLSHRSAGVSVRQASGLPADEMTGRGRPDEMTRLRMTQTSVRGQKHRGAATAALSNSCPETEVNQV